MDWLGDDGRMRSDQLIWGDWVYGPEDDPYNRELQYGDPNLEKKLHGDDDVIIIQRRDPQSAVQGGSGRHDFWAGDGDDTVYIGKNYRRGYGWGGRGDDILYLPEDWRDAKYYGGLGDDNFVAIPEILAKDNSARDENLLLVGDAGNDKIEGPHLAANVVLQGGDGDDKIIGGN